MQIFCRETRAHLEMHPHITGNNLEASESSLITPDLWMKNCKSPSESKSLSPPPSPSSPTIDVVQQSSPIPLITLTHPSKLLATTPEEDNVRNKRSKIQKRQRKRCSSTVTTNSKVTDGPQDLRIRHSPIVDKDDHVYYPETVQQQQQHHQRQEENRLNSNHILPPVTVLVPYPILFPVPLPIPIPLPITSFLKAEKTRNFDLNDSNSSLTNGLVNSSHEKVEEEKQDNDISNDMPISKKRKRVVDKSKIQKSTACLTTTM